MGFQLKEDIFVEYEDEPGVTNVVIPNNVVYITSSAFDESRITSVVIPDSVESIDANSFNLCENLVKVTLPETGIIIENGAFFRCNRFTANCSIKKWNPAFGLSKPLFARNYMNNYDSGDPHYELFHEENSRYIRSHLDKIIETLDDSDTGAVVYLTREKMLSLYRTNMLLDKMSGNIEATTLLLDYRHNTFPAEYLERYEQEETEKELGQRKRSPAEWRRKFKLVSDGSGGWGIAGYRGSESTVVIPEKIGKKTVTRIMSNAFGSSEDHNYMIEEVILPDTIIVIEDGAFECCYELKSITLSNNLEEIGNTAFYSTGLTSVTIPDSVTHIEASAFLDCAALEKVVLPDNLEIIGPFAFSGCENLADITLPEGLSEIGGKAFDGCKSLTEIVIPRKITKISNSMFSGCKSLKKVTLPDSLKSIEQYAFDDCENLAVINIPNGVTEIRDSAFEDCSALTSITLPDSLISLGEGAFNECSQLADITIPPSLEFIGNYCFDETPWLDNQTDEFVIVGKGVLLKYNGNGSEVTIPAGVAKIGEAAFGDNAGITAVTIPEGVVEIGYDAFCRCSCLAHVTLPQSLRIIGPYAFFNTAVCEITIPEGVIDIDMGAFYKTPLRSVTIPQSVQNIGTNAFIDCTQLAEVNLPDNLPKLGSGVFDGTLYLENLPGDYIILDNLLYRYKGKSKKVVVPDNIKVIGERAFFYNSYVTEIVVPDSVTKIGEDAFGNCDKLESIILPDTLTRLDPLTDFRYNQTLKIRYKGNIYGWIDLYKLCNLINSENKD